MKKRLYNTIANAAIALAAIAFALVTGEIAFRTFDLTGVLPTSPHRLLTQYDPLLGWSKIPGKIGSHTTSEYSITERINSHGIRGPEYTYHKHDNEFRILILGDSFAEGYTVEFDQLFSEILKRDLNANAPRQYEIINTGTGGYSTDQELLLFQNQGKLYSPDLTILLFYFNDVWYNQTAMYWRGSKPMFEINQTDLMLTNVPMPQPNIESASFFKKIKSWLSRNSYLYAAIRQVGQNMTSDHEVNDVMDHDFAVFKMPYDGRVATAWTVTEALIAQLKRETTLAGSEFVVFYVPPRFSVYTDEWESIIQRYALPGELWNVEWPAVEVAGICERVQIECIEPTAMFKAASAELAARHERLYFVRDPHWTGKGHELVAEILLNYVRDIAD